MSLRLGYVIGEHILISFIPWLVGCVAGGSLGYICAIVVCRLFSRDPGLRRVSLLAPWRTAIVVLALASFSPFVPVFVGLGTAAGGAMIALFVFLFALPFTASTLIGHWFPASLTVRLVGGFRTLATVAVTAASFTPTVAGSGGAGQLIFYEGWLLADYSQVLRGFAVVILLNLIIDVLLGMLQIVLSRSQKRPAPKNAYRLAHATPMKLNGG